MKKKMVLPLFLALTILSLTLPSIGFAQSADEASQLRALVQKNEGQIAKWERTAETMIVLTILVGVLGIVAGGLQKSQANWSKITTVVIGLSVSAITVILNTAFPIDYRQLRRQAIDGRELAADLEVMISSGIPTDEESHRVWLDAFQNKLHQLIELGKEAYPTKASLSVWPTVYAQSTGRKPGWISKLPDDQTNLYFLGEGDSPSLGQAKEISHDNATRRAVEYFSEQFDVVQKAGQTPLDSWGVSRFVVKSAQEAGIYFEYISASRSYRYYTLLRIPKDIADADLKLYGLQRKTIIPRELGAIVQEARDLGKAYTATPFPYLVGEYEIQQRHFKVIHLPASKVGIYVGDVRESQPAQAILFKADRSIGIREQQTISYSQLKRRLRPDEVLLERLVANQEAIGTRIGEKVLLFEFKYSWSPPRQDYAFIAVKSSTR